MEQAPYSPPLLVQLNASKNNEENLEKLPAATTPMMAQFLEIKAVNPGYLLFYRMGDFYELFFEDAQIASMALGITLTKRGKHKNVDIPMCGVPVKASDAYLKKLISLGYKVAICEQMEEATEAKKRGAKSVVKRDVVRLVTAGTITEDDLLPTKQNNYLCSLAMIAHSQTHKETKDFALAWADISTGQTWVNKISFQAIGDELARINPSELLVSQNTLKEITNAGFNLGSTCKTITKLDPQYFDSSSAKENLENSFADFDISSLNRASTSALSALVFYIANAQKNSNLALRNPKIENEMTYMAIDIATRSSLELLKTNKGEVKGSLFSFMDLCLSAAGSRLLAQRLANPLKDKNKINLRLDMVEAIYNDNILAQSLKKQLKILPDISRPLTRLALNRAGARDILSLGKAILGALELSKILSEKDELPKGLEIITKSLNNLPLKLGEKLLLAIDEDAPILLKDGGFIKRGYNEELDFQRELTTKSRSFIAALQQNLSQETQIKSLKIKHNKVLGFFVDVPANHGVKLLQEPFNEKFIHRQTMANVMRFSTIELGELEEKITNAQFKALEIENQIFANLKEEILTQGDVLRIGADGIAQLDVTVALALLALDNNYCRPKINLSLDFKIKGARHPVVEQTLKAENKIFVVNDCDLSGENMGQLWLLTGPNMGGKSTFLRQNALIAIMGQMGSFVPAKSATIGIVDKVFSRVGASDDIASGRSTFMVEMVETAAILNRATKNSLVILDEIGRGTSTFDGLSIAYATAEALAQINGSRALFATHFHEMTSLAKTQKNTSNHTMKVKEFNDEVVFLHEVISGVADRSYGIAVAKLAGLPKSVLNRAQEVLSMLEKSSNKTNGEMLNELPLFNLAPINLAPKIKKQKSITLEMIKNINPDDLTPLKAVEFLYELKKVYNDNNH